MTQKSSELCTVRLGTVRDLPFIANSYLRSYRNNSKYHWGIPSAIYYQEEHAIIENLLLNSGVMVLVACNPEDEDQIFAYCIAEAKDESLCIHYVYCKQPLRKFGLVKTLFNTMKPDQYKQLYYSRKTTQAIDELASKYKLSFNPYYGK